MNPLNTISVLPLATNNYKPAQQSAVPTPAVYDGQGNKLTGTATFTPTDPTSKYLQQLQTTAYSGNNDYRGYLANLANSGATQTIKNEAAALLNVVGNDGIINPSFLNQSAGANGYNATGVSNYDAVRGQVQGGNEWYGPQGANAINQIYLSQWQAAQNAAAQAQRQNALAAQVNPLIAAYNALTGARDTANSRARSDYDNIIKQYNDQFGIDQQRYQGQVTQNEQNLTGNRQAALLQASQGGQGLRAVLAAMGALNGTGSVLADRAITQAANKDIGDAQNTFETNASTLQGAWADTEAEDKQRRAQANSALQAAFNNADTNFFNNKIDILGKLANAYGSGSSQGVNYANQAASLYDTVAKIPQGQAVSYTPVSSLYSPQNLASYLAGTKNLQVQAQSGNSQPNSPSVVATVSPKRKDELQ